jgi:hypothetical protein
MVAGGNQEENHQMLAIALWLCYTRTKSYNFPSGLFERMLGSLKAFCKGQGVLIQVLNHLFAVKAK